MSGETLRLYTCKSVALYMKLKSRELKHQNCCILEEYYQKTLFLSIHIISIVLQETFHEIFFFEVSSTASSTSPLIVDVAQYIYIVFIVKLFLGKFVINFSKLSLPQTQKKYKAKSYVTNYKMNKRLLLEIGSIF